MQFYRVYHIDARGQIAGLTNFSAASDALACAQSQAIRVKNDWQALSCGSADGMFIAMGRRGLLKFRWPGRRGLPHPDDKTKEPTAFPPPAPR